MPLTLPNSSATHRGNKSETNKLKEKEDAMKTKTNVKAGSGVCNGKHFPNATL
jgi:hypothetical protein